MYWSSHSSPLASTVERTERVQGTDYSCSFIQGSQRYLNLCLVSHLSPVFIAGLEEKVVAVVGVGNSGGDVAVELSKMAKQARKFIKNR